MADIRSLLRPLGIVGYDAIEPPLLAALATEEPLLLVSDHGAAKTLLLLRLAEGLGLEFRHYNASLLQFGDLLGFPAGAAPRRERRLGQTLLSEDKLERKAWSCGRAEAVATHRPRSSATFSLSANAIRSPGRGCSPESAGGASHYRRLVDTIEWKLIEMPLPRLQRLANRYDEFLYSIAWGEDVAYRDVRAMEPPRRRCDLFRSDRVVSSFRVRHRFQQYCL